MSMSVSFNNKPAFGCGKCEQARELLLGHGAPVKRVNSYISGMAPDSGKPIYGHDLSSYKNSMVPEILFKTHVECAEDLLRGVVNCGKFIAENLKKG